MNLSEQNDSYVLLPFHVFPSLLGLSLKYWLYHSQSHQQMEALITILNLIMTFFPWDKGAVSQ